MFKTILNSFFAIITFLISLDCISQVDLRHYTYEKLHDSITKNIDLEQQITLLEICVDKAKDEKNAKELIAAYRKLMFRAELNEAKLYGDSLVNVAKETNDNLNIAISYQTISTYYYSQKDYRASLNACLTAENHILKTDDLYTLYKIRNSIGRIKYHIGEIQEALDIYLEAEKYYSTQTGINNLYGQLNSIFFISKCYMEMNQWDLSNQYTLKGINLLKAEKPELFWQSYFSFLQGISAYEKKDFKVAKEKLKFAIPTFEKEIDDLNLGTIYLYLGKIEWDQNHHDKAIPYFLKVNDLFEEKNQINKTLREAYTYLIEYYEKDKNLEQQLKFTNQLIKVDNYLNGEYRILSNRLRTDFDLRALLDAKKNLEKQIENQANQNWIWILGSIAIIGLFCGGYFVWSNRKQQKNTVSNEAILNEPIQEIVPEATTPESININENIIEDLLAKLTKFEKQKQYLKTTISQKGLAEEWETNTSYLSKVINTYKEKNFKQYINDLRIDYAIEALKTNANLRSYKIDALADQFGFSNARSFTDAFMARTGIKLTTYIKQQNGE